jgi:hypothetical protein
MLNTRGTRLGALVACAALLAAGLSACGGGEDFANEPRPATTLVTSGVITEEEVEVSPNTIGSGPVILSISNQTSDSHRAMVVGEAEDGTKINEEAGPINPQDTLELQLNLPKGRYQVRAASDEPFADEIEPARLIVDDDRPSSSDELLLP